MSALTRWNPNAAMLGPRFNRLFEDLFTEMPARFLNESVERGNWMPAVDVRENEDAIVLEAELPGMTKKDIELSVENNVLTMSGERRFENEENRESYHRIERGYGRFTRAFTLSSTVDREKVVAKFKDGVLSIHLPKTEVAKARRIEIN
jgi:HSP20 family protein